MAKAVKDGYAVWGAPQKGENVIVRGGNGTIKNEPVGNIDFSRRVVIVPDGSAAPSGDSCTWAVSGPPVKGENAKVTLAYDNWIGDGLQVLECRDDVI